MIRLIIISCTLNSAFAQINLSDFFRSVPAILDSQARLAEAYYGNGGGLSPRGSSNTPSTAGNGAGIGAGIGAGSSPFGAGFPFNNPSFQNFYQSSLDNALQRSLYLQRNILPVPQNNYVNPQNNYVNPQNNYVIPQNNVINPQNNYQNYAVGSQNTPAPSPKRRPTVEYPDIKNSLNNANSVFKNIGTPSGGGLNFPIRRLFG